MPIQRFFESLGNRGVYAKAFLQEAVNELEPAAVSCGRTSFQVAFKNCDLGGRMRESSGYTSPGRTTSTVVANPVAEIGELLKGYAIPFIVDAERRYARPGGRG